VEALFVCVVVPSRDFMGSKPIRLPEESPMRRLFLYV
jgi:hypothetical protein